MSSPQSLWITLQLLFVLSIFLHEAMASFTPYISEFEYSPKFHPSKNPTCPRRWAPVNRKDRDRRSPEEGEPVGQEPSIEIRAVLVRCPKSHEEMTDLPINTGNAYNITAARSQDILEFHGFDRDEPAHHSEVRNCRRKLIVTMKFNNIGKTRTQEEFVVVDHVLDPVTMQKARLLNPFVFKVRQEQVLQLYGLKFQSVVNGEAKEEVINKQSSNYTGCDDSLTNPTCGQMMFDGKPIPYSQGFCCSCDPDVNVARQPIDRKSEALSSLGNSPRMIPGVNEKQILSYEKMESTKLFPEERFSKGSAKNPAAFSKRDRTLKSSQVQVGLDDEGDFVVRQEPNESKDNRETLFKPKRAKDLVRGKKVNEIHFHRDYPYRAVGEFLGSNVSPPLRAALPDRNPSKIYTKPRTEAVRNDKRIREDIDSQILRSLKKSERRFSPRQNTFRRKSKNTNLTADLIELENEYEALKKSRENPEPRRNDVQFFVNNSKSNDFPKLANPISDSQIKRKNNRGLTRMNSKQNYLEEGKKLGGESADKIPPIYSLNETQASSTTTPSASSSRPNITRENFNSTTTPNVTESNLSPRSSSSITTIPSSNINSISTLAPTTHPALILRQELVNDKLNPPLISAANNVSSPADELNHDRIIISANLSKSNYSDTAKPKGQYADWVIKYAKMHSNQRIDPDPEELELYNLDRDQNNSFDSSDSLSHLADKVMKEVESAEQKKASSRRDESDEEVLERPVQLDQTRDNPAVSRSLTKLRNHEEAVGDLRIEETTAGRKSNESTIGPTKESEKRWQQGNSSSKMEHFNESKSLEKTSNKTSERNFTTDSKPVRIKGHKNRGKVNTDVENSAKKMIEPAVIVGGTGDLVKGNFFYQEESATVIADRHFEKQQSVTDQDYIFLDKNGKEEILRSAKSRELHGSMNLKELSKSDGSNNSMRQESIDENNQTGNADLIDEKLKRLNNVASENIKTRRRTYRSIAYDDPFHRSNDKRERKIDQQIEKEFAEISEALNESSDSNKKVARISSLGEKNDLRKDPAMVKDFAAMLNKIPKNDILKTSAKTEQFENRVKKFEDSNSSRNRKESRKHHAHKNPRSRIKSAKKMKSESQTNINEIVKQIIKNDYRASDHHSGNSKNIVKSKTSNEPNSMFSLKSILHRLHIGKLQKKCHDGPPERIFSDEEKYGGLSIPSEDSTVNTMRTSTKSLLSELKRTRIPDDGSYQTKSTVLIEATTLTSKNNIATNPKTQPPGTGTPEGTTSAPVTKAIATGSAAVPQTTGLPNSETKKQNESTKSVTSKREVSTALIKGQTTLPPTTISNHKDTSRSSGANVINSLEKYPEVNGDYFGQHKIMERSPGDLGNEESSTTGMNSVTTNSDSMITTEKSLELQKALLEAENCQLKKEISELKKGICNSQTDGKYQVTDDVLPTTSINDETETQASSSPTTEKKEYESLSSLPTEKGYETTDDVLPTTSINDEEDVTGVTGVTGNGETTTSQVDNEMLTGYEATTVISQENDTDNPEGGGSSGKTQQPPGFGQILGLNNERNAKILLVKTYSVSQNPKEFLDNYEFPVEVRKVLLKKLNLTSAIRNPVDSEINDSLIRKVNKFLINGEEGPNDSEIQEALKRKLDKEIYEDDFNYDIGRRELGSHKKSSKGEKPKINNVDNLDTLLNGLKKRPENLFSFSKNKFVRKNGLKHTRSFANVDAQPTDDETTNLSQSNDVNMTNLQLNNVMEQPIFTRQNSSDVENGMVFIKNDKFAEPEVEFFYDYDSDQSPDEMNNIRRRSRGFQTKPNDRNPIVDDLHGVKERRLKKREINSSNADKMEDIIPRESDEVLAKCPQRKWQGKIDYLKLKKHQDILKEYLNWSPNIHTTNMRIFSFQSTVGVSPTIDKQKNTPDSSTMSIVLVEQEEEKAAAEQKLQGNNDEARDGQLNDKEILEKLSKTPVEDNLMIISVMEKNKLNTTNRGDEKRFVDKKIDGLKERKKVNDDSGRRRNINSGIREARSTTNKGRSGRRLMSVVHLSENRDNGLRNVDILPEGKEETVGKDEAFEKYGELVPKGKETSSFDYLDSSYKKHERDKLKSNWDQLVDKVIINNANNNPTGIKRNSDFKKLDDIPSGEGRTAMEKLHFFNADKYINMLAKKINRLSDVDNVPEDMETEKQAKLVNNSRESEQQSNIRANDFSAFVDDDKIPAYEDSLPDYNGDVIRYETGSRDSQLTRRNPFFGKLGSDFEISISGKLHINGESEGQPMSISIDGVTMDNVTSKGDKIPEKITRNETKVRNQQADGIYFDDVDLGDVRGNIVGNRREIFFGQAGASNLTDVQPKGVFFTREKSRENKIPNSPPSKTYYNVVVRAHPRYQKSPIHFTRDLNPTNDSADDDLYSYDDPTDKQDKFDNGTDNLSDDEPIFDFAKLELRHRKPNAISDSSDDESLPNYENPEFLEQQKNQFHYRKRQARKLREDSTLEESVGSNSDVELVKVIPVHLLNEDEEESPIENERHNLRGRKPVRFITSELPKMDYQPATTEAPKRTEIKPVKYTFDNQNTKLTSNQLRNNPVAHRRQLKHRKRMNDRLKSLHGEAVRDSDGTSSLRKKQNYEVIEPEKRNKICSKISEPCFAAPEIIRVSDNPFNTTGQNSNNTAGLFSLYDEPKKVQLSTDDLRAPSSHGDEILIKGVEISPPEENRRNFVVTANSGEGGNKVYENLQDQRKSIQLKNLLTMMNFVKKLAEILPESKDELSKTEPEPVVQVQSVLLLPEELSGIQIDGNDGIKQLKTTSERVVEIGEGVKHEVEQRRGNNNDNKYPDIIVIGDPTGFDKNYNPDSRSSRIKDKDKPKFSTSSSNFHPKDREDSETDENMLENLSKVENEKKFEDTRVRVGEKMNHRLSEVEEKPLFGKEESAKILGKINPREKNLYRVKSGRSDVSKVNNSNITANLRDEINVGELNENTKDPRLDESCIKKLNDKRFEFKERNELPEIVVRPVKFDKDLSESNKYRLSELDTIANTLDKEGTADFGKKEPRARRDRRARTPLTYAVGVSEMETSNKESSFKSGVRELKNKNKNKKRRTQHLASGKRNERRKARKKNKRRNNNKKKKKAWWPFKRNLLAVIQDEEESQDYVYQESINPIPKILSRNSKSKQRKKRQIKAGGAQIRGGQDCMDRRHPPHVNSARYQESAHCLRFSDLWYSVYQLENPIMEHTVYLQLFEKHTLPDGTTHWDDLTQGSMVRLGTFVRHQRDGAPTIAFTYSGAKIAPEKQSRNLDPVKDRLLVPSPVAGEKLSKYPEVKGGSSEYLVVQSNAINGEGNECDKAGVGFSTFATQPNRCEHPKGTCLKNQPLAYWRHDVEAREAGKPGCYFLSNFASVPNNPIKYNVSGTGSKEYLGLEYHSAHVSAIDIEVRADYNAIVRVGSSGRVTEVYVDSTASDHTILTIVISNMGLASSPYQSRISDCPTGLPVSWSKAKGAMQVIAPQHDQKITLDLYGQLEVNDFHCSVEVVNHRGELVAMRRIRIQKMDRCFCVWHCLCACIGSLTGLGCQPMSPEHYHAAGFQGPVPVSSFESSSTINAIKDVMTFGGFLIVVLLALGMLKWLIGIFIPVVSRWGLDVLLEGSQMEGYFEPELRCRSIVTDVEGSVVHPDTGKKSVRICSRRSEFFFNLIFFLTFPIAVCSNSTRSSLAAKRRNCCQDESEVSLLEEDVKTSASCAKLICVDTYGDSKNSKMEDEDTEYVINELKRSRDSLQDGMGKRCKVGIRNRKLNDP